MITYKKAGVDIDKANKFVEWLKKRYPKIGFFSGFFKINKNISIVATTDGVGTKLKIAQIVNKHTSVGIDLVAMNVNDIITSGAKPIFFLDYIACGKIDLKILKEIASGIIKGCKIAKCELLGGETAELPGMYKPNEYDLAGFACGIVENDKIITGKNIKEGDKIIGLHSSGIHSNGYSLIRKIFNKKELIEFSEILLTPTKIYVEHITELLKNFQPNKEIKAIVNITGGGFYDNIVRVLPYYHKAIIFKDNWKPYKIFNIIQQKGNVPDKEMYRTFNMGIGMIIIVDKKIKDKVLNFFSKEALEIGEISKNSNKNPTVIISGID
ncbi:MAG: phosphoribosylformylglycinamidine cyclo-ligase [Elusimicrobiota bacterium]|nr:phosphoribosylformylglycinamidine cyclo-ligase [Endomicrobiia bacterium]MDW8165322.1 phosphoribosylformylglycinamidine cyclo-ligase [Elusimicrobiota bacterium]